jgi:glycerol-3-phosphate cytidylyltransferase
MKRVITYGTFDLFHYGHLELLRRAKEMGDYLLVGLSTDNFNAGKGKQSHFSYAERKSMLEAIRFVDEVIPESNWGQKEKDITDRKIDVFVMGDDWEGKFDELNDLCKVWYLQRTPNISSSAIKVIHKTTKPTV